MKDLIICLLLLNLLLFCPKNMSYNEYFNEILNKTYNYVKNNTSSIKYNIRIV